MVEAFFLRRVCVSIELDLFPPPLTGSGIEKSPFLALELTKVLLTVYHSQRVKSQFLLLFSFLRVVAQEADRSMLLIETSNRLIRIEEDL